MSLLACPRCDAQLVKGEAQNDKSPNANWRCDACQLDFPTLDSVPFLWAEPGAALLDWRNRHSRTLADIDQRLADIGATQPALAASKTRLQTLATGLQAHRQEVSDLLAPMGQLQAVAKETHLALKTRLPSHHGVLAYTQNIHRDWAWGDEENDAVAELLINTLAGLQPQDVLVLGAGAGRLAYDLAQRLEPEVIWALDSNPLLCLIGAQVSRGETIDFTEFPLAPITATDAAVTRHLSAPTPTSKVQFVCADALRAPFAPASFDLVVTPWLVDVIDASVSEILQAIARLLTAGGHWLNHGSVAFQGSPRGQLVGDELAEMAEHFGFSVAETVDKRLPYLQSPASRFHRDEMTFTLLARRNEDPIDAPRHQHLPDWLVHGKAAVPLTQAFHSQINTTRIHAFIMSLIDGKRSIGDMAKVLEEQRLMPADQAAAAIRQFLTTMLEEERAQAGH